MEVYLPKTIERIYKEIPEKVEEYLKKYSYEGQVEKYEQVMLIKNLIYTKEETEVTIIPITTIVS